jgi:peptidase C13-like protein
MSGNQVTGDRTSLLAEVLAVLRLAFTFRLDAHKVAGRDATIAFLGAAAVAVWLLLHWWHTPGAVKFEPSALVGIAAAFAVATGIAWLLSRLGTPPIPIRQSLWLVAGYLPAAAVGTWLMTARLSKSLLGAAIAALAIHAALYFFFGLRAFGGRPQWMALSGLAVGVSAVLALVFHLPPQSPAWSPHQSPHAVAALHESRQRTEELLYAQAERIDAALNTVSAAPASEPRMYFVGFAGFGEQRVFTQEVELAAQRVHERYDTHGRRVILANDWRDFDEYPLASGTALRRALLGIAKRMDRQRDVLFLALSSHGKNEPRLVVSNGALPLDQLRGDDLARILRESGIRWKVVVISACYAGAFIPYLKDEDTIVITAAAPDRTSFGCNDRRDLTYFGEAFYRDALPPAGNLRNAFETALADIAERERRQGLKPSNPQGHFGAAMVEKLAEFETQRVSQR